MSVFYPRIIAITRPIGRSGVGAVSYGGNSPSSEAPVLSGLPAAIQLKKDGASPDTNLPGDAARRTYWNVLIPRAAATKGTVNRLDIVTDDELVRYQVTANYWTAFGYTLLCERLGA